MRIIPSTTVEFIDALKAQKGLTSDYQLYRAMGWKQTTVSSYRRGRSAMTGAHAIRVADELGLSRAYVLACMEAEREHNEDVAGVWKEVAFRFRCAAVTALVAGAIGAAMERLAAEGVIGISQAAAAAWPL